MLPLEMSRRADACFDGNACRKLTSRWKRRHPDPNGEAEVEIRKMVDVEVPGASSLATCPLREPQRRARGA
jgi:hypothetical protein